MSHKPFSNIAAAAGDDSDTANCASSSTVGTTPQRKQQPPQGSGSTTLANGGEQQTQPAHLGERTRSQDLLGIHRRLSRLDPVEKDDRFDVSPEKQLELELCKVVGKTGTGRLDDQDWADPREAELEALQTRLRRLSDMGDQRYERRSSAVGPK